MNPKFQAWAYLKQLMNSHPISHHFIFNNNIIIIIKINEVFGGNNLKFQIENIK